MLSDAKRKGARVRQRQSAGTCVVAVVRSDGHDHDDHDGEIKSIELGRLSSSAPEAESGVWRSRHQNEKAPTLGSPELEPRRVIS